MQMWTVALDQRGVFKVHQDNKSYYSFEPLHKATWQDKGLTPQQMEEEGVAQHSPNNVWQPWTTVTFKDTHWLPYCSAEIQIMGPNFSFKV